MVVWLVLGRTIDVGAAVVGVAPTEAIELPVEMFNGLCEAEGGVDGGGVDAVDEEEEGGAVAVDLIYGDRFNLGIGSFPADIFAPAADIIRIWIGINENRTTLDAGAKSMDRYGKHHTC